VAKPQQHIEFSYENYPGSRRSTRRHCPAQKKKRPPSFVTVGYNQIAAKMRDAVDLRTQGDHVDDMITFMNALHRSGASAPWRVVP
jgi:hypothetical protein